MSKNVSLFSSNCSEPNTTDKKFVSHNDTDNVLIKDDKIDCKPNELFRKWTILVPLVCLIIFIGIEPFYRDVLFNLTESVVLSWQKKGGSPMDTFANIITQFGGVIGIGLNVLIYFFCFPLMQAFIFISLYIVCLYFDLLMKLIYAELRPFLVFEEIFKECESGFGNPSGHSFGSVFIYLCLYSLLAETKWMKERVYCKYLFLFFMILLSTSVCLSRIYLGVHSINQVVYGACLGLTFYFICCHGLALQRLKFNSYKKFFININSIITFSIIFFVMFLCLVLVYTLRPFNIDEKYYNIYNDKCGQTEEYKMFENDGMSGGLLIFTVIGGYYGQVFLWNKMRSNMNYNEYLNDVNKWNQGTFNLSHNYRKYLIQAFIFLGSIVIPIIMLIVIKSESLWIIFVFRIAIPTFWIGLFIFGIDMYLMFIVLNELPDAKMKLQLTPVDTTA